MELNEIRMIGDIPVCGTPIDQGALAQIQHARTVCEYAAMMADHHKGYGVPIGGVVASQELVCPAAVGYDIACGNRASRLDLPASEARAKIGQIMDDIVANISFGVGRPSGWNLDHPVLEDPLWDELPCLQQTNPKGKTLKEIAKEQLGTVGSGNHYVDILIDEEDRVWVGVHFGSRGTGHKIARWFLDAMKSTDNMDAVPKTLHYQSDLGAQYLKAMEIGGEYAYAGRNAVVEKVATLLGAKIVETVHNHHNFTWKETIDGREYFVGRKGATPAHPGQLGFVGGSMGDNAVIIEGTDSEMAKTLFHSTVHGAGRVMSRTAASGKRKFGKKGDGTGLISQEMMHSWISDFGVVLRGADTDEAPQAYKRLPDVLAAQGDSIRVIHTLRPIGVAMAGADTFDPYKD